MKLFPKRSQYISIKFTFLSSNLKNPGCASKRDVLELATLLYLKALSPRSLANTYFLENIPDFQKL